MKEYLSIKEAAQRLDVEYKTVWRLVNDGKLPAAKVRGVWRIRAADLEAFFEQQRRESAANRCAACGRRMESALSVGGRCQVCEAPLCLSCWRIEERRFCRRHQPEEAAREAPLVRCGRCQQVIPSIEMAGGRCEAPDCEALLCVNCWRDPEGRRCLQHTPTTTDKLEKARARLQRGEIDRLVTSMEAKTREISFVARFDQKIHHIATLRDPVSGTVLHIANWDRHHVADDDTARLLEIQGLGYLDRAFLQRMPLNLRSRYEVPMPSGDGIALIIEAVAFSHLEAHARDGFDTAPATLADLLPYLEAGAAQAEALSAAYVLGIAATSGWDAEATRYIHGGVEGRSYSHRLLLPYLIDLHTGALIYNRYDERLAALADLFSPRLFGEEVQAVMEYVRHAMRTSGLSSLTARQVAEALAMRPEVVQEAFRRLSKNGEYTMEEIRGLGLVIARK